MTDSQSITVPVDTLRLILDHCRTGLAPMVPWSESREQMNHAALQKRQFALQDIENEVEALLPVRTP